MTVGAGDNDFSDYGQGCFQITPKLVAAGDVVEIYKRLFAEKNLLHVGKIGELCNTMNFIPEDTRENPPRMGCALGISMGRFFDERNSLES